MSNRDLPGLSSMGRIWKKKNQVVDPKGGDLQGTTGVKKVESRGEKVTY